MRIGIACYPLIGGSGILASALAMELAKRGHEVHVFSYAKPVRLDATAPRIHFHAVEVGQSALFKYPDYSLPLAVKMACVADDVGLDIIHAHYAVPHAVAAYLAKRMSKRQELRIVATLHGTDTTLFGKDPNYRRAIEYALRQSDLVTTVSGSLRRDTFSRFDIGEDIKVIPNFFEPSPISVERQVMREKLGLGNAFTFLHASNLRPVKRVDLLLRAFARADCRTDAKLLILAGSAFAEYESLAEELGIVDRIVVAENESTVENYIHAADACVYTSESESFCLGILEAMFLERPSVAFAVGGIPEVIADGETGVLHPFGDVEGMSQTMDTFFSDRRRTSELGEAARKRALRLFTADQVVPVYEDVYRSLIAEAVS